MSLYSPPAPVLYWQTDGVFPAAGIVKSTYFIWVSFVTWMIILLSHYHFFYPILPHRFYCGPFVVSSLQLALINMCVINCPFEILLEFYYWSHYLVSFHILSKILHSPPLHITIPADVADAIMSAARFLKVTWIVVSMVVDLVWVCDNFDKISSQWWF